MATREVVPSVSLSLDQDIARVLEKLKTASSNLDQAIHFISSSLDSDPSFLLQTQSSFSFLVTLYNLLESAEDDLKYPTMKMTTSDTGIIKTGDNLQPIAVLDDPAISKALVKLNAASSRILKAIHFIHPKLISPQPFGLHTINSLTFLRSLNQKVEGAIDMLTKRLEELTASKSPSRWKRFKKSFTQIRKSIRQTVLSCFCCSGSTKN